MMYMECNFRIPSAFQKQNLSNKGWLQKECKRTRNLQQDPLNGPFRTLMLKPFCTLVLIVFRKDVRKTSHERCYLEGIIPFKKWLTTMISFRPLRIGLWDPFQMAELHGL